MIEQKISKYISSQLDQTKIFFVIHAFSVFVIQIFILSIEFNFSELLLRVSIFLVFYFNFYKAKSSLLYSYWGFSFAIFIYLILAFFSKIEFGVGGTTAIGFGLMAILGEMYILAVPHFYPSISWWEYDFRYKHDLKCMITTKDSSEEGRILDVRRQSMCLSAFEKYHAGDRLVISNIEEFDQDNFEVEVVSEIKSLVGRPNLFGVKSSSSSSLGKFKLLVDFWKKQKIIKRNLKYGK